MQSLAACQRPGGAFLRQGTGRVLTCVPTPAAPTTGKPAAKAKGGDKGASASSSSSSATVVAPAQTFDVTLSDTVLFPEGGGQPTDTGVLRSNYMDVPVLSVLRTPNGIVHRVAFEIAPGTDVDILVDWNRRFDHMQCHSTQHLISAVARQEYNLKTVSWWLASAPQECHIEFDGILTPEQMVELEQRCNDWIRKSAELKLHTFDSLAAARADEFFASNIQKSIPDSHEGAIRVIEIEGLDFNPCCGTHLTNTSQMQLIKLTRVEKSKTASKLFFYTGNRSIQALSAALDTARSLTAVLSVPQEGFITKVNQLQTELRTTSKTLANALTALAVADAQRLASEIKSGSTVVSVHRDETGLNFLGEVADQLAEALKKDGIATPYLLLASSGDSVGAPAGTLLLVGDEAKVSAVGAQLATKLTGKGGGRKGRFQGKATGLDEKARNEAIEWLKSQM